MTEFDKTNLLTKEQKDIFCDQLFKCVFNVNSCDNELTQTCRILSLMEFDSNKIEEILQFFKNNGGYCDCEVILNVICADDENIMS